MSGDNKHVNQFATACCIRCRRTIRVAMSDRVVRYGVVKYQCTGMLKSTCKVSVVSKPVVPFNPKKTGT